MTTSAVASKAPQMPTVSLASCRRWLVVAPWGGTVPRTTRGRRSRYQLFWGKNDGSSWFRNDNPETLKLNWVWSLFQDDESLFFLAWDWTFTFYTVGRGTHQSNLSCGQQPQPKKSTASTAGFVSKVYGIHATPWKARPKTKKISKKTQTANAASPLLHLEQGHPTVHLGEFWKLVWCKFWRSWEQNAEKGSFIDMDVYNKYTIYEVYKLFFKKKRCRNFVRKQLFASTKMMLLWFFC